MTDSKTVASTETTLDSVFIDLTIDQLQAKLNDLIGKPSLSTFFLSNSKVFEDITDIQDKDDKY
jgi:hypothetical protein